MPSATWLFTVPLREGARRAEDIVAHDVDSDGYADFWLRQFPSPRNDASRVYRGGPAGLESTPSWTLAPSSEFGLGWRDEFARARSSEFFPVGDLDGDGFNETIVRADRPPGCQSAESHLSAARGFLGVLRGYRSWYPAEERSVHHSILRIRAPLGIDLDDDGFVDMAMYNPGRYAWHSENRWWIDWGSSAWPPFNPEPMVPPDAPDAFLPLVTGDFDGDGMRDVLDGPRWIRGGSGRRGAAVASCPSPHPFRSVSGADSVGDFDADGFDDAVLSFGGWQDGSLIVEGRSVARGSSAGLRSSPCTPPEQVADLVPAAVPIGDFDGDGHPDTLDGPRRTIYFGGPSRPRRQVALAGQTSLSSAPGDVDGDGYDDLIVSTTTGLQFVRGRADGRVTPEPITLSEGGPPPATLVTLICAGASIDPRTHVEHCGSCGVRCASSERCEHSRCVVDEVRPIVPRSSHRLARRLPSFRWRLPARNAVDAVRVELCRMRSCATVEVTATVAAPGTSWQPPGPLAFGPWFWRIQGLRAGRPQGAAGPTWMFSIPRSDLSPGMDRAMVHDLDSDGFEDLVVYNYPSGFAVYRGGATISAAPLRTFGLGSDLRSLGDIDGDGFNDTLVTHEATGAAAPADGETLWSARGGTWIEVQRLPTLMRRDALEVVEVTREVLGDVDDDGFADLSLHIRHQRPTAQSDLWRWMPGGPSVGLRPAPNTRLLDHPPQASDGPLAAAGDLTGDGVPDARTGDASLRLGGTGFFTRAPVTMEFCFSGQVQSRRGARVIGDVTGDGRSDLYFTALTGVPCLQQSDFGYVLPGATRGTDSTGCALVATSGADLSASWRWSVGDIDGDGRHDFLSPYGFSERAESVVFRASGGSANLVSASRASFVAVGDLNGDGFDDLLLLASSRLNEIDVPGAAIYLGGARGPTFHRNL